MKAKQPQAMCPTRAPQKRLQRNRDAVAWLFSRLWRASDPILFQMTIIAALWVTVFGKCGPPPDIPGALLVSETNKTEFESFEFLKYSCRPGYIRATSGQTIYCEARGTWTVTISCVKKSCRNPGDLPNGQVEIKSDFSLGSRIEFSCLEGYILIGSSTSYCEIQSKGVAWSDPLPDCVSVKCRPPPDISHGRHSGGDEDFYTYGSSITYRCYPNFSLIGSASITCTVVNKTVGVWSPSPPTCERINCPQPYVLHGVIDSGFRATYKYKDSVRFACQKGTILRGKNTISCEADGNWHPSPPVCEPTLCQKPDIRNGMLSANKDQYVESENATIQCNPGFALLGSQNITCLENGTWYPEMPKCEQDKDCEHVFAGKKLMQCLSNPNDVKMALEVYKLSREIELLELQITKAKQTVLEG
ncbi:C4b-binding protein-like [Microtus pennsylvanicus]|uniref:C4b-binding protein-like n=1 Tax=Microtus pennsylvanicus TaxID=10058 RepID=UPI003F6BF171